MKKPSRKTRLLLASFGAAAVFAAVTVFAVSSAHRPDAGAPGLAPAALTLPATVPALAAADSDTVVMAPFTGDWWRKVAAMAPAATGLLQLEPAKAGAPVLRVGYTRGPDHGTHEIPNTGPLRLVYLETASTDDAATVATWLKNQPGFENRRVHIEDRTVIAGQSWNTTFDLPGKTMASVAGYRPGDGTSQGSMWMNIDQEVVSMAGGADTKNGLAYTAVLAKAVGFEPGTTWLGFSDNGDSWKGDFRSGGVSKDQINLEDAKNTLAATDKVLYEHTASGVTTKMVNQGPSNILNGTSISAGGASMGQAIGKIPGVDDQLVQVVNDVTTWNSAASGTYSGPENLGQRVLSASAKSMVISYSPAVSQASAAGQGHAPFGSGTGAEKK